MGARRPTVVVTAAILRRGGEILLCHRHPQRGHYPDVWDLPGGHLEAGESLHEALARELQEELGISIELIEDEPWRVIREGDVELSLYLIDHWLGEVQNRASDEHDEIRWVAPTQLPELRLANPIYESLLFAAARQE